MNIVLYLLNVIQHQSEQIAFLLKFIRKFIPINQWVHDDSKSPKYQKFKIDRLPHILPFFKQDWRFLIAYYARAAALVIKPFVDTYDYGASPSVTFVSIVRVRCQGWQHRFGSS